MQVYTQGNAALFARSVCARCPYEKDIFIFVDRGDAHCSTGEQRAPSFEVRDENGGQKKREGKKKKKNYKRRVRGKSASPVRRSHYRLGFDCSGSTGTGATRYTLYSASVRFLEIHSVEEGVHADARRAHVYVHTCTRIQYATLLSIHGSLFLSTPARNERRRKKKQPGEVCRSIFDYVRQRIRDIKDNYGLSTQG